MLEESASCLLDGLSDDDAQPSLLPWSELAHAATPVVALQRPLPGIARCVVAPVPLLWLPASGRSSRHESRRVRCLAVDDAGNLAAPEIVFRGDAKALLAAMQHYLAHPAPAAADGFAPAPDAVAALRDPLRWRLFPEVRSEPPELPSSVAGQWALHVLRARRGDRYVPTASDVTQLLHQLGRRLHDYVDWVIGALAPPLADLLRERDALSCGIACQLLRAADRAGGAARRYAEQALRCEPLPTLRLMAEGGSLAAALFDGSSVPRELARLAQVRAVTVRHLARQAQWIPDLPSPAWLQLIAAVDRLPAQRRPHGPRQWGALVGLLGRVTEAFGGPDEEAASGLTLAALLAGAQRVALGRQDGRENAPGGQGAFDGDAGAAEFSALLARLYLELSKPQPARGPDVAAADAADRCERIARFVCAFGAGTSRGFCDLWLGLLPEVPPQRIGDFAVRLLRTSDEAVAHGRALGNCLTDPARLLEYLGEPSVLLAIDDAHDAPCGLAQVALRRRRGRLCLEVDDALGIRNTTLPAPAVEAAEVFAAGLSGQAARLENFTRAGEALARLTAERRGA